MYECLSQKYQWQDESDGEGGHGSDKDLETNVRWKGHIHLAPLDEGDRSVAGAFAVAEVTNRQGFSCLSVTEFYLGKNNEF